MERKATTLKALKKSQAKKLKYQSPSLPEANPVVEVHPSESVHLALVGLLVAVVAAEAVLRSFKDLEWLLPHLDLITAVYQHLMKSQEVESHHRPHLFLPSLLHSRMRMKRRISLLHVPLHLPLSKDQCRIEQVLLQLKEWILYLPTYSSEYHRIHQTILLGHHFVDPFFLGMGLQGNLLVDIYRLEVQEGAQEGVYLSRKPDRPRSLIAILVLWLLNLDYLRVQM